jgi:hypothetical protein
MTAVSQFTPTFYLKPYGWQAISRRRGLTQAGVARACRISPRAWRSARRGKPVPIPVMAFLMCGLKVGAGFTDMFEIR